MKALITGGAGFIGSHLAERLLLAGDDVVVVDDLSTGRLENLSNIKSDEHFRFVQDNVRNSETMHVLIEQCDVVLYAYAARQSTRSCCAA